MNGKKDVGYERIIKKEKKHQIKVNTLSLTVQKTTLKTNMVQKLNMKNV